MTTEAEQAEINKRVGAAVRMHMDKAKDHVTKAAACHGTAMAACAKAAGIARDMATTAKAAGTVDVTKSATDMMSALHEAHGALSAMSDHHDLACMHMDKAAGINPTTVGTGAGPWGPAPASVAMPTGGGGGASGYTAGAIIPEGYISKAHADEIADLRVKAAAAEAKAEVLSRMPAGIPKGRSFEIGKAADGMPSTGSAGKTPQELLLDGVTVNMEDGDSRMKAAGRMIGNMITNAGVFGKNPALDPTFRGGAG